MVDTIETPPTVTTPIDASGSDLKAAIITLTLQAVGFVGLLVGVLGLSDHSIVVKIYKIASSSTAIPMIGYAAGIIAGGYQLYKRIKRNRQLQTFALLPTTPDSVAIGPSNPSAAVQLAVSEVMTKIAAKNTGPTAILPNPAP